MDNVKSVNKEIPALNLIMHVHRVNVKDVLLRTNVNRYLQKKMNKI